MNLMEMVKDRILVKDDETIVDAFETSVASVNGYPNPNVLIVVLTTDRLIMALEHRPSGKAKSTEVCRVVWQFVALSELIDVFDSVDARVRLHFKPFGGTTETITFRPGVLEPALQLRSLLDRALVSLS